MEATSTVFRSNPSRKSNRELERAEALTRAVSGQTMSNYPAIASVNLIWPLLIFSFGPTLW